MANDIMEVEKHSNAEKLKAAYALNMCTVSVSQIVDYHDSYILEQEYDAILNNLNLKEMPKDEALLKILTQLLDTITFYRIQEIKKAQIDKKYRQRIKNAFWSAVPSLSVVVSGNPVAIAISLATQIGSGYMNYRKEKANAGSDREDAEIELEITAIEQLNALRRELFTTAWRLADEYDFDDEWRLTEKQIKQYNEILMDQDEYRKYARLRSIADKFIAYPPFWYFYGHTAAYIAEMAKNRIKEHDESPADVPENYWKEKSVAQQYSQLAKEHFEHYYSLCSNNILREDQITASFALEYIDLLWDGQAEHAEKIYDLLKLAEKMAPTSFDILQLCAISYLRIGQTEDTSRILEILVNEDYNTIANAKLLSKLYVSKYLSTGDLGAYSNYSILESRTDPVYLYPMPDQRSDNQERLLEDNFIARQKAILKKEYRNSLDAYAKCRIIEFNSVIPAPYNLREDHDEYYSYSAIAKEKRTLDIKKVFDSKSSADYVIMLKERGFRYGYVEVMNSTITGIEELSCFRKLGMHDRLIHLVEMKLRNSKPAMITLQEQMDDGSFSFDDYLKLINDYSYKFFTEDFFSKLKIRIMEAIDAANNMSELNSFDQELTAFCSKNKLPAPDEYIHTYTETSASNDTGTQEIFFSNELLGEMNTDNQNYSSLKKSMSKVVGDKITDLVLNPSNISVCLMGDKSFDTYFQNDNLRNGSIYLIKQKAVAIIDDKSKKDYDLILGVNGITVIAKNKVKDNISYADIKYSSNGNNSELKLFYPDTYSSRDINISELYNLITELNRLSLEQNK